MTANPAILAAAGLVLMNRVLLRAGLRRRIDGWRRATGLLLRNEGSTFVLSAFGLDTWSDVKERSSRSAAQTQAHLAQRLAAFLDQEPACHVDIRHDANEDRAVTAGGPSYTLAFQPWAEGHLRFVPPGDWSGERAGGRAASTDTGVLLNVVCRVDADGIADVWVRVNHVGADGVPVQEILSRLEAAWGVSSDLVYPSPAAFSDHARPRPLPGRPGFCEVQAFIDFEPLLTWRKRENTHLGEPMTVSAAMLWCLSRQRAFADLQMGTTVEVAARDGLGRGVGVVVVRPAGYPKDRRGLARYVADFNLQLELTRRRASGSCQTLDAAALIPPKLAAALLRHALDHTPRAFETMALTMLKDARVFGAPIAQTGHPHGFIAVGSVALPSAGNARVGCVTVKGPAAVVPEYPRFIQEAVERCGVDSSA